MFSKSTVSSWKIIHIKLILIIRLDLTGQSMAEFHVEHLGKLKNLILSKNSISKMLYDGLVNLEQLVLSNNRIEQLYDMGDLKKLVSLDLSSNRIAST
jgi:Leucine-rich repeat (LRR) protein